MKNILINLVGVTLMTAFSMMVTISIILAFEGGLAG